MVTRMSDEIDDRLAALFAEVHETLPSAEFMQAFLVRMERARRLRSMRRIALALLLGAFAIWIMPAVLTTTATVMRAAAEQSRPYAALLISPVGWGASMLIAFLVLLRTGALRRK
jgi:hypothetical protein